MAILFSLCGLLGVLPIFQSNQLTQIVRDVIVIPAGWATPEDAFMANFIFGLIVMALVSAVIFGGLQRIVHLASRIVPFMVVVYVGSVLIILFLNITQIPHYLWLIVYDAFTAESVLGGAVGTIII
ncbi:alanine:cation symporter family protein, partial [Arthrospira platensis SPKY1]|nr:alanine:cation symporter family protein [Arthrospira platensis SPKY1]